MQFGTHVDVELYDPIMEFLMYEQIKNNSMIFIIQDFLWEHFA